MHDEQVKLTVDSPKSPFAEESISLALLPHTQIVNSLRNSYLACVYF